MKIGEVKADDGVVLLKVHRVDQEVIVEAEPDGDEQYLDSDEAEELGILLLLAARKVLR